MQGIRLLGASIHPDTSEYLPQPSRSHRQINVATTDRSGHYAGTWVTVVIGRNGLGKSRLLGGIASLFDGLANGRVPQRGLSSNLSTLEYQWNSDRCVIKSDSRGRLTAMLRGVETNLDEMPRPSKVIALSTTAFDKYPLPRRATEIAGSNGDNLYRYMGLRDVMGRSSATSAVFRALDALFNATASTTSRRTRIAEVFEFLGYLPQVEVSYRMRFNAKERLENLDVASAAPSSNDSYSNRPSSLERMLTNNPGMLPQLREVAANTIDRLDKHRNISLVADFAESGESDTDLFRSIQLLRRADLISMSSVELVRRDNGKRVDLRGASSGELALVTTFLGLAAVIEDGSLILVDEPEVSLHPAWQTKYVELLTTTFSKFKNCHYIIATHSPLILGDIAAASSNVVSLDELDQSVGDAAQYAGKSSDYILLSAFEVPGKNNLYLKQLLVEALRLAADGESDADEFQSIMRTLVEVSERLDANSPVRNLILELKRAQAGVASQ